MDENARPEKLALLAAEELLRLIYGDDFQGCPVSLDAVALLIDKALKQQSAQDKDIIDAYEKVIEALHFLSRPPAPGEVPGPAELQRLLSDRLDAIHSLTSKAVQTATRLRQERKGDTDVE